MLRRQPLVLSLGDGAAPAAIDTLCFAVVEGPSDSCAAVITVQATCIGSSSRRVSHKVATIAAASQPSAMAAQVVEGGAAVELLVASQEGDYATIRSLRLDLHHLEDAFRKSVERDAHASRPSSEGGADCTNGKTALPFTSIDALAQTCGYADLTLTQEEEHHYAAEKFTLVCTFGAEQGRCLDMCLPPETSAAASLALAVLTTASRLFMVTRLDRQPSTRATPGDPSPPSSSSSSSSSLSSSSSPRGTGQGSYTEVLLPEDSFVPTSIRMGAAPRSALSAGGNALFIGCRSGDICVAILDTTGGAASGKSRHCDEGKGTAVAASPLVSTPLCRPQRQAVNALFVIAFGDSPEPYLLAVGGALATLTATSHPQGAPPPSFQLCLLPNPDRALLVDDIGSYSLVRTSSGDGGGVSNVIYFFRYNDSTLRSASLELISSDDFTLCDSLRVRYSIEWSAGGAVSGAAVGAKCGFVSVGNTLVLPPLSLNRPDQMSGKRKQGSGDGQRGSVDAEIRKAVAAIATCAELEMCLRDYITSLELETLQLAAMLSSAEGSAAAASNTVDGAFDGVHALWGSTLAARARVRLEEAPSSSISGRTAYLDVDLSSADVGCAKMLNGRTAVLCVTQRGWSHEFSRKHYCPISFSSSSAGGGIGEKGVYSCVLSIPLDVSLAARLTATVDLLLPFHVPEKAAARASLSLFSAAADASPLQERVFSGGGGGCTLPLCVIELTLAQVMAAATSALAADYAALIASVRQSDVAGQQPESPLYSMEIATALSPPMVARSASAALLAVVEAQQLLAAAGSDAAAAAAFAQKANLVSSGRALYTLSSSAGVGALKTNCGDDTGGRFVARSNRQELLALIHSVAVDSVLAAIDANISGSRGAASLTDCASDGFGNVFSSADVFSMPASMQKLLVDLSSLSHTLSTAKSGLGAGKCEVAGADFLALGAALAELYRRVRKEAL